MSNTKNNITGEDKRHRYYWLLGLFPLLYLAALPLAITTQAYLIVVLLLILIIAIRVAPILKSEDVRNAVRLCFIILAAFITLRYFFWRTTTTITYVDPASFMAAITLYLAEVYGITIYLLGAFVNAMPLHRKSVPLPDDAALLPTVDILIPTYNEDIVLLEVTLLAATQIAYPKEKFKVYLLDDGGTVQMRNDPDPSKAADACQRHELLQALAHRVGAHYITRERNERAKAGNINHALNYVDGELVLMLDADHVPAFNILQKMVGFFINNAKLFLVQTPHFFINPDPIERNLNTYDVMPSENEMFYNAVQHGLDFWGGSFFCGSAALMRRSCLDEVGGICLETVTEDAETALSLHSRGYESVYLGERVTAGLQPESFTGFIIQRVRWSQGMVQIFMLKNPLRLPGLTLAQRLAYTSCSFFWFFPFARLVYFIAPVWFLFFGMQIYDATLQEFAGYALPHFITAIILTNALFGKTRWPFVSELYETMQSLFTFPAIIRVLANPRSPIFGVTPKSEKLNDNFISPLAIPFYVLIVITIACIVAAVLRYLNNPDLVNVTILTGGWAVFNLMILLGALGALLERRQQRVAPRIRMPVKMNGALHVGQQFSSCHIFDVSATGAGLIMDTSLVIPPESGSEIELVIDNLGLGQLTRVPCTIKRVFTVRDSSRSSVQKMLYRMGLLQQKPNSKKVEISLEFKPASISDRRAIVAMMFGDNEVLSRNFAHRQRQRSILGGFGFVVLRGIKYSFQHIAHLLQTVIENLHSRRQKKVKTAATETS